MSTSTVTRLAPAPGYSGFPAFQQALVTLIATRARRRASQRLATFERLWKEARTHL